MTNSVVTFWQHVVGRSFPWLSALLIATAIVSPDGAQPLAALMFVLSLPLFFWRNLAFDAPQPSRLWLFALLMPLIASVPLFVASGTGEALAAGARYFVAAVTLLALSRVRLDKMTVLRAASASGILAVLFNVGSLQQMRVDWGVGFLDSAYIGVLLLCLALAQFHLDRYRPAWRLFAAVGIVVLIFVILKTGARGAWPAMLLVLILQFALLNVSRLRKVAIAIVGLGLIAAAVVSMPSISQRIELTMNEIKTYYENGNRASSMGYRLDFWHIAMNSFRDSPIWGVSYQRRSELMSEFAEKYPQSISIGNDGRSSSHNEVLNAMSKRGLIGTIAVLLLYLVPLRYFASRVNDRRGPVRQLAMAGGAAVLAMMVCGITEAPLMNVRVGTTFGFILVFIYHLIMVEQASTIDSQTDPAHPQ